MTTARIMMILAATILFPFSPPLYCSVYLRLCSALKRIHIVQYELRERSVSMPGSFRLGRIAGIDIYIHFSLLIILVFLTWSLATGWFAQLYPGWSTVTYWIVSLIAAVL